MAVADELRELHDGLAALERETRHNTGVLASTVRRTRLGLSDVAHDLAVRRLRQPTHLIDWQPRVGVPTAPEVQNSLLDRLRRGNPVADSLGNVNAFYGQTNLLDDPTFEANTAPVVVGFGLTAIGPSWSAFKVAATAATATCGIEYERVDGANNSFNTGALRMKLVATGAGTHELVVDSTSWVPGNIPYLPYLVAAVRTGRFFAPVNTNVVSRTLILELVDATGPVVRASSTIDLDDVILANNEQAQLVASSRWAGQTWQFHTMWLRVRLVLVTTGATGDANFHIGEPQLSMTYSPDPPSFTPLLASWNPRQVTQAGQLATTPVVSSRIGSADTNDRFTLTADGMEQWGGGAAALDLRLFRNAAGAMIVDSNAQAVATDFALEATAGQRNAVRLYVAGDTSARVAITGDATKVGLELGPGNAARDTNLYRLAANVLATDDDMFVGGGTLGLRAAGFEEGVEIVTPTAPAANGWILFAKDNGAGKTQLCVIFNTGAVQVIATQP